MSTQVLAPEALAQRRTIARNPFFAVMSAVILLLVLSGFTPTLSFRPLFKPQPIPGYLFLHGIVLTSWFVWFCVQSMLVQSGRTALHRRLGVVGGVLAAIVPFAGSVIVHDIATMRKIHPATLLGVLFPLGLFFICTRIRATDAVLAFVRWLQ